MCGCLCCACEIGAMCCRCLRAYVNSCAAPPCKSSPGRVACRLGLMVLVLAPVLFACYGMFLLFAAIRDM